MLVLKITLQEVDEETDWRGWWSRIKGIRQERIWKSRFKKMIKAKSKGLDKREYVKADWRRNNDGGKMRGMRME